MSNKNKIELLFRKAHDLYMAGNLIQAKKNFKLILDIDSKNTNALTNHGTIDLQIGNIKNGINFLSKSLVLDSKQISAAVNLGNAFFQLKEFSQAIDYYDLCINLNPSIPMVYYNKAKALKELKRFDESLQCYKKTIDLDQNYFLAYLDICHLFNICEKYEAALKYAYQAIELRPNSPEAQFNLGITFKGYNSLDKALDSFNQAIKINPDYAESYLQIGMIHNSQGRLEDALCALNQTIKFKPNLVEAYVIKGTFLANQNKFSEAVNELEKALEIDSNSYEATYLKSLIFLSLKKFHEAWELYESRFSSNQFKSIKTIYSIPRLSNFDIENKSLLITAEQGIGDQILFGSLLNELPINNKYTVTLDSRLINLFERSFKNINFISSQSSIDESSYDYQLPIGSLGKFFRRSIQDFEKQKTSYLFSDNFRSNKISHDLKRQGKFICGIAWKSSNSVIGVKKSIELESLLPILKLDNFIFVNLQYGECQSEINQIKSKYGVEIICLDEINNFYDIDGLASIISVCDVVITTSNVTPHISGSLGKVTFLMCPSREAKIWYWHDDNKSIWYPKLQIINKPMDKNWTNVIDTVSNLLKEFYDR